MKSTRIFIPFFGDGHWVQGHLGNLPNLGNLPDLGAEKCRKVPKNAEKIKSPRIFILFLGRGRVAARGLYRRRVGR